jgi:hypothetical protein
MTDPKSTSAKRNGPLGKRIPKFDKADLAPFGYIAMHEINAAMCMAGGVIGPRFEDGAAQDHHFSAGGLVIEAHGPSKEALSGAVGGLGYGEVVIFEVLMPPQGPCILSSLPLLDARRLVFRTRDAEDQFLARFSGFGDIPLMSVPLAVTPELFSGGAELSQPGLLPSIGEQDPAVTLKGEPSVTPTAATLMRTIDRCAGSFLAALSTTRVGGQTGDILKGISGLALPIPDAQAAPCFATKLAVIVDGGPESNLFAPIFGSIADVLCSGAMDKGFSASELQKLAQPESTKGLEAESKNLKAIESMWSFTKDVLSLRRDVPESAWSDIGGSPLARGTLFFLLNPEPEQLEAALIRNPSLGPRVHFIAGLLVGLRAGLTRLGKETKEDTGTFLTAATFVHTWLTKGKASLDFVRNWEPNDGSPVDTLFFDGSILASAKMPSDPRLANLAAIIRMAGVDARFSHESGALSVRFEIEKAVVTFALSDAMLPIFPRIHLHELTAAVELKTAKRDLDKCVEVINSGRAEHGVSATLKEGPNRPYLQLSVYLAKDITQADLTEAVTAIVTSAKHAIDVFSVKEKKLKKIPESNPH